VEIYRTQDQLSVRLLRDLNLYSATRIERLAKDVKEVRIDLTRSKFLDSEAVRVLYQLYRDGRIITLVNPPRLYDEVIDILGLRDVFEVAVKVERTGQGDEGARYDSGSL
jgi:anti-anti-sigma regulatory factor